MTKIVIDYIEGGYYNPEWHYSGTGDWRYSASGETLYGIDRKNGKAYFQGNASGEKFWSIIDKNKSKSVWIWNYMGGSHKDELQSLVVDFMYPWYDKYAKVGLSAKSREIVESDGRLLFTFIYGVWNGGGWFTKWATLMNTLVNNGERNVDVLNEALLSQKINMTAQQAWGNEGAASLIRQAGVKMKGIFEKHPSLFKKKA
jgi:hypothetical protein